MVKTIFSFHRRSCLVGVLVLALLIPLLVLVFNRQQGHLLASRATRGANISAAGSSTVQHYEYVFPDGGMDVYDIDHNFALVKQVSLPTSTGGRGVAVSLPTHMLYVAYGSDSACCGSLFAYDLIADKIVWTKQYNHGIDSLAITPDGRTIYMPAGEESGSNLWYVENAATGTDQILYPSLRVGKRGDRKKREKESRRLVLW